jgi:hypothetical protein
VNGFRRNIQGAALRTPGPIREKKSNMGLNSLPSDSSDDLDEQITQVMECKPLVEQQVPL